MPYTISFNDATEKFVMEGHEEDFIGSHLWTIAIKTGLEDSYVNSVSESHALAILRSNGIEIELVDIDW